MIKLFAAAALVFGSSQATASHWVQCDTTAEVVALTSLGKINESVDYSPQSKPETIAVVKLLTSVESGGHRTGCTHLVGRTEALQLTAVDQISNLQVGNTVKFVYENVGGLTPTGVAGRITWLLVD